MNLRVFNLALLIGWAMVTAGGLLVRPWIGLVAGGLLLLVLTVLAARLAGGIYSNRAGD